MTQVREIKADGTIALMGETVTTTQVHFSTEGEWFNNGFVLDADKPLSDGWRCIAMPKGGRIEMEAI